MNDGSEADGKVDGFNRDDKEKQKPKLTVRRAVDLCAAPGGWSQVLVERLRDSSLTTCPEDSAVTSQDQEAPKIVAVDLWPMEPLEGVDMIRGDITSLDTATQIIDCFEGRRAEVSF